MAVDPDVLSITADHEARLAALEINPDFGAQYVHSGGSDSNTGRSVAKAKATIEAAVGDLSSVWPNKGGTVFLSGERHIANEIDIDLDGVSIVGMGRGPTTVVPVGDYGFKCRGSFATLRDFKMGVHASLGDAPFYGHPVRIESDRKATIQRVWFHQLGKDYDGTDDIDIAPATIWIGGVDQFSDWHVFDDVTIWDCYRGIVNGGSANFMMSNSDVQTVAEGVYVLRRILSKGAGGSCGVVNSWFTGGRDYLIRLEADPGVPNASSGVNFAASTFERVGASAGAEGRDAGHVWCGLDLTRLIGCKFIGGSHSTDPTPHAVYFDTATKNCVVTGYTRIGQGFGRPGFYGNIAAQETLVA